MKQDKILQARLIALAVLVAAVMGKFIVEAVAQRMGMEVNWGDVAITVIGWTLIIAWFRGMNKQDRARKRQLEQARLRAAALLAEQESVLNR